MSVQAMVGGSLIIKSIYVLIYEAEALNRFLVIVVYIRKDVLMQLIFF